MNVVAFKGSLECLNIWLGNSTFDYLFTYMYYVYMHLAASCWLWSKCEMTMAENQHTSICSHVRWNVCQRFKKSSTESARLTRNMSTLEVNVAAIYVSTDATHLKFLPREMYGSQKQKPTLNQFPARLRCPDSWVKQILRLITDMVSR